MKKFLTSFSIIAITLVAALQFSSAFFSDEETSTNNSFVAGAIDLKVDHVFSSYNGENCEENCVPTGSNLLVNGDFEDPVVSTPQLWNKFPHTTVNGWSADWIEVVGGNQPVEANIELHRGVSGWLAQDGNQYTELDSDWDGPTGNINNEKALVSIYQTVATTPGTKYELQYWHSYRPGQNASENTMEVLVGGVNVNTINTANGTGQTQTSWTNHTYQFTATNATTEIRFTGAGPNNSLGIFLDNVSLFAMECNAQVGNNQCKLWEEKDLAEGDKLWNFQDIKPGDRGVDVFSLHVYDNDAYACLLTDIEDIENDVTDPEVEASDPGAPLGELSKYLEVFIWRENGLQNGIYNPGDDTVVYATGSLDPAISISDPAVLEGSTTYFYGMAWCVGEMTVAGDGTISCDGSGDHNDAQTDTILADFNFYAEQVRNNPDFSCQDLITPTPTPEN